MQEREFRERELLIDPRTAYGIQRGVGLTNENLKPPKKSRATETRGKKGVTTTECIVEKQNKREDDGREDVLFGRKMERES